MPDQYDPKAARPSPRRDALNDPLAELAKIVQGRAPSGGTSTKSQTNVGANGSSSDLEAELLNDLQASFAAVRDSLPLTAPPVAKPATAPAPKPQPPFQPAMRGPIVEDNAPAPVASPSAARPAQTPPVPPRAEAHPELRDEFRLSPVDESRLVPIPAPPVIQPLIQQTSEYQPPPRPAAPERRVEPPRQPIEPPAAAAEPLLERAPRPVRTPPAAEAATDLGTFAVRGTASPAPSSKQAHSRWERPEPPKPQPAAAPSRFAPPKVAPSHAGNESERDPFADAGLLGNERLPPELDDSFPLEGLGMVPGYGDEDGETLPPLDDEGEALAPRRGSSRGLMIAGAVVVIALIGGVAVAMYRSGSGTTASSGTPPVITADQSPTKVIPKPTTGDQSDSPNKLIYDRVDQSDSGASGSGDDTTLVTSNDEPIQDVQGSDTSSNPISRVIIPGGPDDGSSTSAATGDGSTATGDGADDTIGPKRVRTVVVKPDGTIVSSNATNATPDVTPPATPPASTTAASTAAAAAADQATAPTTAPVTQPVPTVTAQASPPPATAAPVTDDTAAIAGSTAGALTITDQGDGSAAAATNATADSSSDSALPPSVITSGKTTTLTASKPAVTAKPAAKPPTQVAANDASPIDLTQGSAPAAATSGVLVQISSQRTEDAARATYKDLQARYPQILGRYDVNIQKADLGDRGTFYRVRVGPFPQADAQHLCDDLRSAGGDCVLATK